ncbi:hypothetical protein ACS0TY_019325 [Phlomoides rotata]
MAYRRRQQVGRVDIPFTYNYDSAPPTPADYSSPSSSASSLATKVIRASSAFRDSSISSVYEQSALSSPRASPSPSSAKGLCGDPQFRIQRLPLETRALTCYCGLRI